MPLAKHWCFTLNNPEDEEESDVEAIGRQLSSDVVYLVFGREKGVQETPHLQGFISFGKRKSLAQVRRLVSSRAHFEVARGSPKQAADYCKKDDDFEEFGVIPRGQGERTDLAACIKAIKEGKSLREIAEEHPSTVLRYGSGVQRLRMFVRPERKSPPEIWTLWGKTGTGKTRRVWEFADVSQLWCHPGDRWFDGYDGQDAVLFDDFDGSWFKLSYLLKLLDRYVFQVPVKGGYTWWAPKTIYLTSNLNPTDWYGSAHEEHKRALLRRLNEFGTIQECFSY